MKVYVVEVGAYSDAYIDAVFTTRDLAETYIVERARRQWRKDEPFPENVDALLTDPRVVERRRRYPRWEPTRWEAWRALVDDTWNTVGDVDEFDLWDTLPIVTAAAS